MTVPTPAPRRASPQAKPLRGAHILSLALNLPGPAAMQRLRSLGASCTKIEPPLRDGQTADPMANYSAVAYADMHRGITVRHLDLKQAADQARLHRRLAHTDVLITAFRPSAMTRLGLDWASLHARHPHLFQVAIVGGPGSQAERAGHDLTYQAKNDLVVGLDLPATLYADMSGALLTTEAVLAAVLLQRAGAPGQYLEVALSAAAAYLAQPRAWGATAPESILTGRHAGYKVYACRDGRVALAALEPHFAQRLIGAMGLSWCGIEMMMDTTVHNAVARYLADLSRAEIDALAATHDIPLQTLS